MWLRGNCMLIIDTRKNNTEQNKIRCHFSKLDLKVISGVLKVMTLQTHGDFLKRLPPNLKLGSRVTQMSVVAVIAYQSTHTIYHLKDN